MSSTARSAHCRVAYVTLSIALTISTLYACSSGDPDDEPATVDDGDGGGALAGARAGGASGAGSATGGTAGTAGGGKAGTVGARGTRPGGQGGVDAGGSSGSGAAGAGGGAAGAAGAANGGAAGTGGMGGAAGSQAGQGGSAGSVAGQGGAAGGLAGQGGAAGNMARIPLSLQPGDKVLWVGNSYSDWYGPTGSVVNALLNASNPPIRDVTFVHKGKGMGILKEYYEWASLGILAEIRKGGWKYVVIQSYEDALYRAEEETFENGTRNPNYVGDVPRVQANFTKYVGLFKTEIEKVGARMVLYQPQVNIFAWKDQYKLSNTTHAVAIAAHPSVLYVPVIEAWERVHKDRPPQEYRCFERSRDMAVPNPDFMQLLFSDCGHQNGMSMALAAYTFYTVFTGKSGQGLSPTWPGSLDDHRWNPELLPYLAKIGFETGGRILEMLPR